MSDRIDRLRGLIAEGRHAGLIVSSLINIHYLTGFTGSNAVLAVPATGVPIFWTDGRYTEQARDEVHSAEQRTVRDVYSAAREVMSPDWSAETHELSVDTWRQLGEPRSAGRLVESLRMVKDEDECERLRTACEISTEALRRVLSERLQGQTEIQIARRLEWWMRELGAEDRAFETIIASGPNSAIPHHRPTDRPVASGDLLKIDFGARVDGYHADCTRTVVIGDPESWQREIHAAVREAHAVGVAAVVTGSRIADVDAEVRGSLAESGWLEAFTTGLGHGVGLQIHEDPFFSAKATGRLDRRMVLTMEPGIYLPGRGGVRIEDTVQVSDEPIVYTDLTTELMEIT